MQDTTCKCNMQRAAYNRYGIGVPKNDALAFEYYRSAAERGSKEAQNNLGYCFRQVSSRFLPFPQLPACGTVLLARCTAPAE